ncbi:MAG: DNA mismatch repair endonuclease MutL [Bacteroidota bacterium]
MTNLIHLLPDSIANQIAAGEVVQRPASVVKELLENSVDAGATSIQLIVREGGKTLVQVIDDGSGMSETDARMSFERHATSKIRKSEDLFTIRTMGFRGEALASIAAVAQVEMRTRRRESELGTLIRMEGSDVKAQETATGLPGTNILVKNLFFNVPARRNFLKSNSVEMRHILDEFQHVALAHPDIAFSLYQNDLETYNLPAGKLSHRIVGLFGKNYREQLAACQEETPFVNVLGYIGKPEFAKRTRGEQFFFVNKRYIRHNYLHHAVMSAFEGLLPDDCHPFYVLFLEIDPIHIDINVHPTKTEIKFDDERSVYSIVMAAVKKAMGLYNIAPSLDFESDVNFMASHNGKNSGGEGGNSWLDSPELGGKPQKTSRQKSNETNWNKLYEEFQTAFRSEKNFEGREISSRDKAAVQLPTPAEPAQKVSLPSDFADIFPKEPESQHVPKSEESLTFGSKANETPAPLADRSIYGEERITFQLHHRYILTQVKSGMLLVDQQAAHERVLYEKYLATLAEKNGTAQQMLFPQTLTLNPSDFQLVMEIADEIRNLGFVFDILGQNTLVVHGIPADVPHASEKDLLEGLIEQFKSHQSELRLERRENLARSLARRSALKPGVRLSIAEMNALIDQLFASSNPHYAPGGNPTLVMMNMEKIAGLFKG